jgi:hypothetical protein
MSLFLEPAVISFYISILGILGMIGFKAIEVRSGKKTLITKLSDRTNHRVYDAYIKVKRFISYFNRKSALALIEWIAYHILSWARGVYLWIYKKAHEHGPTKRIIDMVRGKGDANRNGGSSFYFKNLTHKGEEDKKEIK